MTPIPMDRHELDRRRLQIILILGVLSALGPLSIDMYLPAFAAIGADFGVAVDRVELSLASYFLGLSLGQIFYGTLTDRYGRKKPLYAGLAIYVIAAAGCALARSIDQLIVLRFLQALGACAGAVISRAVVRDLFGHRESARIFSALLLVMGIAPIVAPLAGGFLVKYAAWPVIFWICAGFAALTLIALGMFLPESKAADPSVEFRRAFHVYAGIFRDREFLRNALAGGFAQAAMFAYITASPNVFINVFGVAEQNFGWLFGANAAGLILCAQINSRLTRSFRPDQILRVSISMIAVLGVVLVAVSLWGGGLWLTWAPLFLFISTLGVTFPNSTADALASQGVRAGSASALIGTIQFVLAAMASGMVSAFHEASAFPMAVTMATCGMASALIYFGLEKKTWPEAPTATSLS